MSYCVKVATTALVLIVQCLTSPPVGSAAEPELNLHKPLSGTPSGFVAPNQLNSALFGLAESQDWEPTVDDEVGRGLSAPVYAKAGPAVVVVRVGQGHGTGFLIDDGWIVTNQHVAVMGLLDLSTGARVVDIHFGRYQDRLMNVDREAYPAVVYATDETRDLALLRLVKQPAYFGDIKPIKIATSMAAPGDDCISIGHPSAGLLWTLRSGEITGVGNWPQEHIDSMMASLATTGANAEQLEQSLAGMPKRHVLLSTCPINPGDSGGPLLNVDGDLLGITFGIPKGGTDQGISLDKFSYHVHADELTAFIKNKPQQPEVAVPSPWPAARLSSLEDADNDGHWDTWSFALEQDAGKTGIMFDLDQDTPAAFKESYITDEKKREDWDFEFAITFTPFMRTFYDTDNDGQVDLILSDVNRDQIADLAISKQGDTWQRIETTKQAVIDPNLLKQEAMAKRLATMLK